MLDVDALRARPGRAEVARFWRRFRQDNPRARDPEGRGRRIVLTVNVVLLAAVVGVLSLVIASEIRGGGDAVAIMVVIALLMLAALVLCASLLWRAGRRRTPPRVHWALAHFAQDNALEYAPGPRSGTMRAWWSITGHTVSRAMSRRTPEGRRVEWADYEIRNATSAFTYPPVGGWIAIGLRRPLPHIVVRATRRGTRAFAVAAVPDAGQRLSLEGDFDEHFALYCPEGYEADALYLFTPDVMAQAIDEAGGWDIEIVDDLLLMVHPRNVVTTDPERWVQVVRTADAFASKLEQWERWRETQHREEPSGREASRGATGVAPAGRRLRTSWGVFAWVTFGLVAALFVAMVVVALL